MGKTLCMSENGAILQKNNLRIKTLKIFFFLPLWIDEWIDWCGQWSLSIKTVKWEMRKTISFDVRMKLFIAQQTSAFKHRVFFFLGY